MIAPLKTSAPAEAASIFDKFPRRVRDLIYTSTIGESGWVGPMAGLGWTLDTIEPSDVFGLLCASRQAYQEVSAALFERVALGGQPLLALKFLKSIGDWRIPLIRQLAVNCKCWNPRDGTPMDDWNPVFDYLQSRGANFRVVKVDLDDCWNTVCVTLPPLEMKYPTCHTQCETESSFWRTLTRLKSMTTEKFIFGPEVTEYLVHHFAQRLAWPRALVGFSPDLGPTSQPKLEIANPDFLHKTASNADLKQEISSRSAGKQSRHFMTLPLEIRQEIYDYACSHRVLVREWPIHPRCFNLGIGLMQTCTQIAAEARRSLYREIDLFHGYADEQLELLGRNIELVKRVNLHFTQFCPSEQETSGQQLQSLLGPSYGLRQSHVAQLMRTLVWTLAQNRVELKLNRGDENSDAGNAGKEW
jgi:hypothetical protein